MTVQGWFPAPNGEPRLWFWTGAEWIDPVRQLEDVMVERLTPLMEKVFAEGFRHGAALAARAAQSVLQ